VTRLSPRALVLALAVVFAVVGAALWWAAYDARTDPVVDNLAVHDATATAEVRDAVSQALVSVLSYDYADPATTDRAADEVLGGDARREYDQLVATLHEKAPDQQLVLTATIEAVGVKELDDDSAELLVFLDQSSRRATDAEARFSAAQLAVTAERTGDTWRITGLTPL
jgi:Mce-associated membrane protein